MEQQGFVVIGAGLPRTGTTSLRLALSHLLNGPIYHMDEVLNNPKTEDNFWIETSQRERRPDEWRKFLPGRGFRGGVDNPISMFYK